MFIKFGKILSGFILIMMVAAFAACSNITSNTNSSGNSNNSSGIDQKIVGSWKNTDEKITSIQTFSSNGDWQLESADKKTRHNGKFVIKNGYLIVSLYDESGRKNPFDDEYKIVELTDDSMSYVLPSGVKMSYRKQKP